MIKNARLSPDTLNAVMFKISATVKEFTQESGTVTVFVTDKKQFMILIREPSSQNDVVKSSEILTRL